MIWNPNEGIQIGSFTLRFYSLMFVVAFISGYYVTKKIFTRENESQENLDKLFIYTFIATLLGARLGHVFFYDWDYFQDHLLEILLPFKFEPKIRFTGFAGLASHGAAIGIILSMYLYSKNIIKKNILWTLDRISLPVAIGGTFVRIGNFFNSEIYGHPVAEKISFGIKFVRESEFWYGKNIYRLTGKSSLAEAYKAIETNPKFANTLSEIPFRHPTQLYEAAGYLTLFVIMYIIYWKTNARLYKGKMFGIFLILLWTIRFMVEFVKESQGGFEASLGIFSTGQWLSIPFILIGFYLWLSSKKKLVIDEN